MSQPDLANTAAPAIYTIGHSTRTIDAFIQILNTYGIEMLVDVRRFPKSRRNPQFNDDALSKSLPVQGIGYLHMEALGGRRKPEEHSENTAWKEESFRGYADYMQTPAFAQALDRLTAVAGEKKTAIMCAEAVPWRCHRSLIADALLVRGFQVEDILDAQSSRPHRLTPWAKVEGEQVRYPGGPQLPGIE